MKFRTPAHRLKKREDGGETLERIKRWPSLAKKFAGKFVLIRSDEWGAFWGPKGSGYVVDKRAAGLFRFEDAFMASRHCGPEKGITYIVGKPEYTI